MKTKSVVVIGLGTFGSSVARSLAGFGNQVLGIDSDEQRVARLADVLSDIVIADARDENALREAGVEGYDTAVVAIGEDLEANILCTMNARTLGVANVWVKALSETHHRILSKLGADRIIHPEEEMGQHIAQVLHNPMIRDYISLGNGLYVVDIQIPEALDGYALGDSQLDSYRIHCLGQMRGTELVPGTEEDRILQVGDRLLLFGERDNLRRFGDTI